MAQLAASLGQRCEHGVAVGDGFVAGRLDAAGQSFCGTDGAFHVAILSRRLARPTKLRNFTTEFAECAEPSPARASLAAVLSYSFGRETLHDSLKSCDKRANSRRHRARQGSCGAASRGH